MPRGATLSASQVDAWRHFHRMQSQLIGVLGRELTQATGLSEADYEILTTLSTAPRSTIRARDLRWQLAWEKSRLSHQLRRMEERGLLRRTECTEDFRGTIIVLTPTGRAAIRRAEKSRQESVRRHVTEVLDERQLAELAEISATVLEHLGIACERARAERGDD